MKLEFKGCITGTENNQRRLILTTVIVSTAVLGLIAASTAWRRKVVARIASIINQEHRQEL